MKERKEELLVINRRKFFLIIAVVAVIGVLTGYLFGYLTTPVKEIYVQKTLEPEKTVLPSLPVQTEKEEKPVIQDNKIVKGVEAIEKPQQSAEKKEAEKESAQNQKEKHIDESIQQKTTKQDRKEKVAGKPKIAHHKKTIRKANYTIQLGAFSDKAYAEALSEKLRQKNFNPYFIREQQLYKVRVGYFRSFKDAKKMQEKLSSNGFESFITKISKTSKGGQK